MPKSVRSRNDPSTEAPVELETKPPKAPAPKKVTIVFDSDSAMTWGAANDYRVKGKKSRALKRGDEFEVWDHMAKSMTASGLFKVKG